MTASGRSGEGSREESDIVSPATTYSLVIANRNYSSWSLRASLFLRASGIAFREIRIPMFTATWREQIAQYSPAGRVPVLLDNGITVWDTAAIVQYVGERQPEAIGWPIAPRARAHAQSIFYEMHSGFLVIRDELPQNIRSRRQRDPSELTESCIRQIRRIDEIWSNCRSQYGSAGEWLFGEFSLADIMYIPVALRFRTYGIEVSSTAEEFLHAAVSNTHVQEWTRESSREPEAIEFIDELVPAAASPLTLG